MAVFWDFRANPPLILRRDDCCSALAAALRSTPSAAGACRPVRRCSDAQHVPPHNRGSGLKSQIKSAMTWHYILLKSPPRANNINSLLDALGQQLLKIGLKTQRRIDLVAPAIAGGAAHMHLPAQAARHAQRLDFHEKVSVPGQDLDGVADAPKSMRPLSIGPLPVDCGS
jgi:hypothetical protein